MSVILFTKGEDSEKDGIKYSTVKVEPEFMDSHLKTGKYFLTIEELAPVKKKTRRRK